MLGELAQRPGRRRGVLFVHRQFGRRGSASLIDDVSLVYQRPCLLDLAAGLDALGEGDWRDSLADKLETLRRPDGGYAKAASGSASSTYHTFLVVLGLQLLDRPFPGRTRSSNSSRGSGQTQAAFGKSASENAAARIPRPPRSPPCASSQPWREKSLQTAGFLASMQNEEGGWRANMRIPFADLWSTLPDCLRLWTGDHSVTGRSAGAAICRGLSKERGRFSRRRLG